MSLYGRYEQINDGLRKQDFKHARSEPLGLMDQLPGLIFSTPPGNAHANITSRAAGPAHQPRKSPGASYKKWLIPAAVGVALYYFFLRK